MKVLGWMMSNVLQMDIFPWDFLVFLHGRCYCSYNYHPMKHVLVISCCNIVVCIVSNILVEMPRQILRKISAEVC